jgi:hypothetical protein
MRSSTARRLDAFGDPDTHYGAAARDAIFNLERALDSALADARNTLADARNAALLARFAARNAALLRIEQEG